MLALAPEELGAKLLFFAGQRVARPFENNGMVNLTNAENELRMSPAYQARWAEASLALTEAWVWLEAQGLLVPAGGVSGSNGWRILSRRARQFESEADFRKYAVARSLPRDMLHPRIQKKVWMAYMRSEFDVAVFQAMKAVEVAVRAATSTPKYGVDRNRPAGTAYRD